MKFNPIQIDWDSWIINKMQTTYLEKDVDRNIKTLLTNYISNFDDSYNYRSDGIGTGVLNNIGFHYIIESKKNIDFSNLTAMIQCIRQSIHYLIKYNIDYEYDNFPNGIILGVSNLNCFIIDSSKLSPIIHSCFLSKYAQNPRESYDRIDRDFSYGYIYNIIKTCKLFSFKDIDKMKLNENEIVFNINQFLTEINTCIESSVCNPNDIYTTKTYNIYDLNTYRTVVAYLTLEFTYNNITTCTWEYNYNDYNITLSSNEDYQRFKLLSLGIENLLNIKSMEYFSTVFNKYQTSFSMELQRYLLQITKKD